jgi:small-conductance mechanosensitive channel
VAIGGLHVVAQAVLHGEPQELATTAVMVAAIVILSFGLTRLMLRVVDDRVGTKPEYLPLGPPIKMAIKIAYLPLVGLMVLQTLHVEILPLLTTLGVASLAVALALQDTLANVIAGIQLVIDQPIRAGDFVELDADKRGTVHEIGLRSTKIRTLENNMIIVPNYVLATSIVTNTDAFDPTYQHRFVVGVGYGSDSRQVQRVLEEVCEQASKEVAGFIRGPAQVRFMDFGDSALIFRVEIGLLRFIGHRLPIGELYHRIFERFAAEGIEIPFPQRVVHRPERLDGASDESPGTSDQPRAERAP